MASVALRPSRSFSYPTASESSALAFALRVGEADPTGAPKPRLLDRVRVAIRARHYSRRTEKALRRVDPPLHLLPRQEVVSPH